MIWIKLNRHHLRWVFTFFSICQRRLIFWNEKKFRSSSQILKMRKHARIIVQQIFKNKTYIFRKLKIKNETDF